MNRLLSDTVNFGKQFIRTKTGAFFAFAFPVLLILLFGAVLTGSQTRALKLPVQNLDTGRYSAALLENLTATGYFEIDVIDYSGDITQYIRDNSITLALLIPSNFSENVEAFAPASVTLYGDMSRSSFQMAEGVIGAVINQMNFQLIEGSPVIHLTNAEVSMERFEAYDFFLPGFVGLTIMVTAMYFMTGVCAEHRARGYFKLLATTTLRKPEWLSSKFLLYTVILLVSLVLTFLSASAIFDLKAELTPMAFALVIGSTYMFTSLGMLLGTVVGDPESATALSNAVGFPMMFLSGSFWDLSAAPGYLQMISKALPLTYVNDGLRDTMIYGNEASAAMNLAIILLMGTVFFILGSRLMSWKEM